MLRKFFIQRFRRYFVYVLVPTVFVLIIALIGINSGLEKDIRKQSEHTIANVKINLDYVINNVIYQNSVLTNNSGTTLALKKLLSETGLQYGDAIYLRNIQAMLRSITQSNSYIASIYLYLDDYNKMFTSDYGVVSIKDYSDSSWMDFYKSMDPKQDNYTGARVLREGRDNPRNVISIYKRMLLQKGVIIVNIDTEDYKENLKGMLLGNYENLYLINSLGELLLTWSDGKTLSPEHQQLFQNIKEADQNKWIRLGSHKYRMQYDENESYGITIVSLISYDAKLAAIVRGMGGILLIFFIYCMIIMAIAYMNTKRIFKQINYMVHVFDDASKGIYPTEPKRSMRDEFDIIMNNIIYLFLNTVQLNSQLKEKEYEHKLAELTALQLQINPHFLYNTLQSVDFEIRKYGEKTGAASKGIQNLSDILKYSLGNPLSFVTLEEEIEYLKKYVEIQKYRFGDKFIVYYEIEEEVRAAKVFRLMLQPLVENSILHGLRGKEEVGYIKVKCYKKEDKLYFYVIDTGVGMSKKKIQELHQKMEGKNPPSIGLRNINSRLFLRYGEESCLKIRSKKGYGSIISFYIPYETEVVKKEEK